MVANTYTRAAVWPIGSLRAIAIRTASPQPVGPLRHSRSGRFAAAGRAASPRLRAASPRLLGWFCR